MSEGMMDPSGSMANESSGTGAQLLDAQGRVVNRARQAGTQAQQTATSALDQIGDYVRHQPVSTALMALGIGYIIGRLKIL